MSADATPRRRPALQVAIEYLNAEIERAIKDEIGPGGAARRRIPWRTTTEPTQAGTFEVEVHNLAPAGPSMVLCTPTPNGFLEDPTWRLAEAVRRKSERIGKATTDVVLHVDFDLSGVDPEDLPALQAELEHEVIPFREVWVADLGSNPCILRVWPSRS